MVGKTQWSITMSNQFEPLCPHCCAYGSVFGTCIYCGFNRLTKLFSWVEIPGDEASSEQIIAHAERTADRFKVG